MELYEENGYSWFCYQLGIWTYFNSLLQFYSTFNLSNTYLWKTNLFTRCLEHVNNFRSGLQSSFMLKHQNSKHRGEEPNFKATVTARTRDCLGRQVREAILIRRSQVPLLNGKSEWHQPALFRVQHEMERGWLKCGPSTGDNWVKFFSMILCGFLYGS